MKKDNRSNIIKGRARMKGLTELNAGINSARLENGEMDEEKLNKVLTELYKKYDIPDIDIESEIFDFS